ncbi:hypothetical protein JMJ35_004972 [Cladonia borealis]|uniref:Uncharacterized protein n=1 Tax=Cladonia borealis TaxID=184061 RepID=A0AA39V8K4_9LECA|nr:hypothetical protein JMJ35_004972 [Cladonia borealis]
MKSSVFTAVGLAVGVATACVTPPDAPYTCPTETYNEDIGFDITPVGSTLKGEYHHLTWTGLTVKDVNTGNHTRGIHPHSPHRYALATLAGEVDLSISGTKTTTFDIESLWFGCLAPHNTESGYAAVECQVSIDCDAPSSMEGHLGPSVTTYTPTGTFGQQMQKMDVGYKYCTDVPIWVSTVGGPWDRSQDAVLVIDSVSYVAREGEVELQFGG